MCESVAADEAAKPMRLEEISEPLDAMLSLDPLAVGAVVNSPDGKSFHIASVLTSEAQTNVYEAVLEGTSLRTWLREAQGEPAAARLQHEARVLEDLDCPMFPKVMACFENDARTYLATESLSGATLAEALTNGQLSFSQALSLLAQVAFALTHLHAHGWVHLGLRPSRIIIGRPVRVQDLSYATQIGEKPAGPFYHAGYSPPELLREEPVDGRADVYAVGALLFHAVSGRPIAETGPELATWEPPRPIPGIPQILHRCLGDRKTRYPTMEALHRDLLRLARRCAPTLSYSLAAATTIGLDPTRTTNQDAHAFLTGQLEVDDGAKAWAVLCVADGMGGMAAGELASEVAVKTVLREAATELSACGAIPAPEQGRMVQQWLHAANEEVCATLESLRVRGGCTMVCACVVGSRLTLAHLGDCRAYLVRKGTATLLTRDHSLAMALVAQGQIEMNEIRHHADRTTVTRSLGDRRPLPDYLVDTLEQVTGSAAMELQTGDVLVLLSDGLWEPVLEEEMVAAVERQAPDLRAAANALLTIAVDRGAPDNATVVLLRVEEVTMRNQE